MGQVNASLNGNDTGEAEGANGSWAGGDAGANDTSLALGLDLQTVGVGVFLALFILSAIVGNILVILSVACNRHLQTVTNYFIINLAIADLLLSTTVLPFSATLDILGFWAFGRIFCDIWAAVDVLCCTASIMSLCIISVDRYIGVKHSLKYPTIMTEKKAGIILVVVWLLSMVISIGPLLGWKEPRSQEANVCTITEEPGYAIFSSLFSFYLPLTVILVMYFNIYVVARRTTKSLEAGVKKERSKSMEVVLRIHCRSVLEDSLAKGKGHTFRSSLSVRLLKFSREKKAAKTLAIVVGVFVLCWLPFFFVLPFGAYFPSLKPSEIVFKIIFWLGYFNSCVNPIIYPCSSKEFKRAFIRLLKCQCRRRRRPIWRVYGNHWRGVSINGGGQDSDGESRSRISTLNGSFILNSGSLERPSKRRTLSFKRWRMFSPFQKPTTQLKEKMNSLSNKIRGGSAKGGVTASYRTEVESVSIGIPSEFMESIDYPMYDELTDSESRGLSETDI
ncbi:alpha-1D adrenergic receptor isoform X2 [Sphaerodactylus townsendi]|uniref:alpha-1D adrenergic receptor isoform X2 n=1 Tax=Sphaerodactylus townsendi TaxID=933632 RepID=UPI002026150A|nr:alpha-1D adrenergic receptor isoform X2 [Sphaerodactylus townsendi]